MKISKQIKKIFSIGVFVFIYVVSINNVNAGGSFNGWLRTVFENKFGQIFASKGINLDNFTQIGYSSHGESDGGSTFDISLKDSIGTILSMSYCTNNWGHLYVTETCNSEPNNCGQTAVGTSVSGTGHAPGVLTTLYAGACSSPPPSSDACTFCTNGAINPGACTVCGGRQVFHNKRCVTSCTTANPCKPNQNVAGYMNGNTCVALDPASGDDFPTCSTTNVCGQTVNGTQCPTGCTATNSLGGNINNSCITTFNSSSGSVNPNGSVEFKWSITPLPPNVGSRCGFVDLTTPTPRPIPGLQNLDPNQDRARISNIQATTRFCLICQFYNLLNNSILGNAAAHQWVRVIRVGEN